ncbi:acriflavine resistance protein B [Pseudoxanthomonas broegbernensis]|uniref:Acriflavine resistance protein B n=1 Tax=Pseudoxanthomonas broegbernensis TaxID=83619 RepID=A0A7V8GKV8_9GAMM|nr:efflux RND transporter permease subunit [Pseudoxanthomonas broegbernensis]KAF1685360.1 acriflavine resistance protein B [Pseudoxanthomonas broegbernensis]MBB6066432.1 HAE1 family hydrophobic/amphiphilic exporter-1 [Pseudoxanthomonas broegbernensis]
MNISTLCLNRPIATLMLWLAVVVLGVVCWLRLPISALPRYETPTIEVEAKLPGASPQNMATSIATPLEKEFSAIPGLVGTTSTSIQGETKIQLEFEASRSIDAAAADVQAALFRISRSLPSELPAPPSYKKINPGDAPIVSVALNSPAMPLSRLNTYIDEVVVPALSTVPGVAQVTVKGRKRYAVRVHVDPHKLAALDLTLLEVASALKATNANTPLGQLDGDRQVLMLQMDTGLMRAEDFSGVVIAARNGSMVQLGDVAQVVDSVEDAQNTSEVNGTYAIVLDVRRQPGANTVAAIDGVTQALERLRGQMPSSIQVRILGDRSLSIRHAIHDVNLTLGLTVTLVVLVIFLFLRRLSATVIPAITVPVSLLGTFALMWVLGLSLNNISLMGLTIAVGLVVDDAIVVLENIMRHREDGLPIREAVDRGSREVGFTVVSISVSLVAVFIPIFFMPGTMGLLFHEFAIVVSSAILVSAAVSLTLIPAIAPAILSASRPGRARPGTPQARPGPMEWAAAGYAHALRWALGHRAVVLWVGLSTILLTALMYHWAPKGFFPQEDTGQVAVKLKAPPDMAYAARLKALREVQEILLRDDAVRTISSKVDHDSTKLDIDLKARGQRPPMAEVLARMRKDTNVLPGISVSFSPVQNLKVGANTSSSAYQYTLQSIGSDQLDAWAHRLLQELKASDVFADVESDAEDLGLEASIRVDRNKLAMLGVDMASFRNTMYAAFGAREVSTIYAPEASYKVIMELADAQRRDEQALGRVHVRAADGSMVPLGAIATFTRGAGKTLVAHKAQLPSHTLSFELAPGYSLSDAQSAIAQAGQAIGMPDTVFGSFDGQAALYEKSQSTQVWLLVAAVAVIYLILGVLYESWIHPVTILLGIPSAAVGALLALRLAGLELTFIAMVGILLLIGIVKKNAIMMIDFALEAQRTRGWPAERAIQAACRHRFRPIMMTTICAMVGALPLALGLGAGAELRQPMGVAVVGGLVLSQVITLLITPVLFLTFDRWAQGLARNRGTAGDAAPSPLDGSPA